MLHGAMTVGLEPVRRLVEYEIRVFETFCWVFSLVLRRGKHEDRWVQHVTAGLLLH